MNEKRTDSWVPEIVLEGTYWKRLDASSRLWVYVADRLLSEEECQGTAAMLESFTRDWASHGSELNASWKLQGARVVLIALDESKSGASGCSIDASVRCMQRAGEIGGASIDWLRRDCVLYRNTGDLEWSESQLANFWMARKAGRVNDDTEVLNTLCANKGEWESGYSQPFRSSWHKGMW